MNGAQNMKEPKIVAIISKEAVEKGIAYLKTGKGIREFKKALAKGFATVSDGREG
jgi:hypothetical protein